MGAGPARGLWTWEVKGKGGVPVRKDFPGLGFEVFGADASQLIDRLRFRATCEFQFEPQRQRGFFFMFLSLPRVH